MIWLRMGQAMARLGVTRKTLRKYCEAGVIRAKKIPTNGAREDWRICAESLEAFGDGDRIKALAILHR